MCYCNNIILIMLLMHVSFKLTNSINTKINIFKYSYNINYNFT